MATAKGLSVAGQLLISRVLGPAEFGQVAVVLATMNVLTQPVTTAWSSALVRYGAGQPESVSAPLLRRVGAIVSTSVIGLAVALVITSPLSSVALGLPPALLIAGAVASVSFVAWLIAKAACQAREDWDCFVAIERRFGVVIILLGALLGYLGLLDWVVATALFAIAYTFAALAARKHLTAAWRARAVVSIEPVARFGRLALFTAVSNTIFFHGDRFVAQRLFGFSEVGVYQLYSFATVGVATIVATLVNNFAFPLAVQRERRSFGAAFKKAYVRFLPLTVVGLYLAGALQVYLAGFPFRPMVLALASVNAAVMILASFFGQVVLSCGVAGSRVTARVSFLTLLAFAALVIPAARIGGLSAIFGLYALIFLGVFATYERALNHLLVSEFEAGKKRETGRP
jgi:O-antigen/teichoic acid export membrane protein